jgi:signal transduction histidine kinase
MKTAFISNISHELRTPLNIISGFTQVLSDPSMDIRGEERRGITDMMMHNANLITQLVDELIDLSITDSSAVPETKDVIDCNELCREVIESNLENKPEAVQLRLQSQVDDGYQLLTNRGALRKVLNALVDNALKNTEQGQVRIVVSRLPSAVAFAVEDTGCGIPAAESARIFERFEKLDSFKSGLGLGLPLARRLTERLGGTLQLDTSYSGGARFVVTIPLP